MVAVRVEWRDDPLERRLAAVRAAALLDVGDELAPPLLQVARDRVYGEVAERAERAAEDARADVVEQVEIGELRLARLDLLEQLHHPTRAFAARRALAARLVHIELRRAQRELHHAAAVVDDDQRRGAEERADLP